MQLGGASDGTPARWPARLGEGFEMLAPPAHRLPGVAGGTGVPSGTQAPGRRRELGAAHPRTREARGWKGP